MTRNRGPRVTRSKGTSAAVTYLAGNVTMRDVAARFGMTAPNVHRWVKKLQKEQPGVEYRERVHPEDELTL